MTQPKKKKSIEEFVNDLTRLSPQRDNYVTDAPYIESEVTKQKPSGYTQILREEKALNAAPAKAAVSTKGQSTVMDMAPIFAAGATTEAPPQAPTAPVQAQAQVPTIQPPKTSEPPNPTGDRVVTSSPYEQLGNPPRKEPQFAEEPSAWERALIGATPLLVGLLSGNQLEGVQTSANYFVKEESGRYDRTKKFNDKLREMKAKRDLSGSVDGKLHQDKFQYKGSDGLTRYGRYINGRMYQDETTDPLVPAKEFASTAPKVLKEKMLNPKTGKIEVATFVPGDPEPKFWGEAEPKFKPTYQIADVQDPGSKDRTKGVKVSVVDGEFGSIIGDIVDDPTKGYDLENRLEFLKKKRQMEATDLKYKRERELNKDRESVKTTKNTREVAEAHGKIMASSFGKDPISDTATIFALFKMLDPGSVVRESEQALGMQARSYDDLVNNVGPILMKQRYLTSEQVKRIRGLAQRMYQDQLKIQSETVDGSMKQRANEYGLNPNYVAPQIKSPYQSPAKPKTIKQGNFIYKLNEKTGEYE